MTYRAKIQRAQAWLHEAHEEAEAAGDLWTAEEVAWALARCRNAEILASSQEAPPKPLRFKPSGFQ